MLNLEQAVAGKTVGQINDMADKLERIADAKAAAAAKAKTVAAKAATKAKMAAATAKTKGAGAAMAKTKVAGATAGTTKAAVAKTATASAAAKSGGSSMIGACCSSKGWSLGLGIGLGPWGPVLLAAGGAVAGYYIYKNYFKAEVDAPSF